TTATVTISLHDALPIYHVFSAQQQGRDAQNATATTVIHHQFVALHFAVKVTQTQCGGWVGAGTKGQAGVEQQLDRVRLRRFPPRSEEHTSELQSRENLV